jgi:hypothetical protein
MMNMNQKNIVTATAVLSVLMATAVMGLPSAFAGGDEEYTSSTETEAKNKQKVVSSGDGVSLGCQENNIHSQDWELVELECDNIGIDIGLLGNAQ